MLSFLEGSPAASPAFKSRLPVIRGESDDVGFALSGVVKDARVITGLAEHLRVSLPAISASLASFVEADALGFGDADLATMVRLAAEGKTKDGEPALSTKRASPFTTAPNAIGCCALRLDGAGAAADLWRYAG